MPGSLKRLVKTGMRNPFYVEVQTQDEIFATAGQPAGIIASFDDHVEAEKVTEIPSNLTNYYHICENQA